MNYIVQTDTLDISAKLPSQVKGVDKLIRLTYNIHSRVEYIYNKLIVMVYVKNNQFFSI